MKPLVALVVVVVIVMSAVGHCQEPAITPDPDTIVSTYESDVETATKTYQQKVARLDSFYIAKIKELRDDAGVKLGEAQNAVALNDLDEAVRIRDIAKELRERRLTTPEKVGAKQGFNKSGKALNQKNQIPFLNDQELVAIVKGWLVDYRYSRQLVDTNKWQQNWWHSREKDDNRFQERKAAGDVTFQMQPVISKGEDYYVTDNKSKGHRWYGIFIPSMRPVALFPLGKMVAVDRKAIEADVNKLFEKQTAETIEATVGKIDEERIVNVPCNKWSESVIIDGRMLITPDPRSRWNARRGGFKSCDFRGHMDQRKLKNGMLSMALVYRINGGDMKQILGDTVVSGKGVIEFGTSGLSGGDKMNNNSGSIAVSVSPVAASSFEDRK